MQAGLRVVFAHPLGRRIRVGCCILHQAQALAADSLQTVGPACVKQLQAPEAAAAGA
jgi:hypothetical protein